MTLTTFRDLALRLHGNGYSPIPTEPAGKRCLVKGWQKNLDGDTRNLLRWYRTKPKDGVGLVCGKIVAVDIDIYDEDIAEACAQRVIDFSKGLVAPVRFGQRPKRLLMFRCAGEYFSKRVTPSFQIGDQKESKVEILAKGQMFVAFGMHPVTRQPYEWPEGSPCDIELDDLPPMSATDADHLKNELTQLIEERGGVAAKRSVKTARSGQSRKRRPLSNAKCKEIKDALSFIDPQDREDWIAVGHALKQELGKNGLDVYQTWSKRRPDGSAPHNYRGAADVEKAWHGFSPDRTSLGAIVKRAQAQGYIPPNRKYDPTQMDGTEQPYYVEQNRIYRLDHTSRGVRTTALTNFSAQLTEDICRDDGAGEVREYKVKGRLVNGTPLSEVAVPAGRFGNMSWVPDAWGAQASMKVGMTNAQHTAAAIQFVSNPAQRRIYTHTGWRKIGTHWHYLHGSGAIAAIGHVPDIEVELGRGLTDYQLPDPALPGVKEAVLASLRFLEVAPKRVTWPLLAATYRSVLAEWLAAELSVFVVGPTGTYKTCLAALCVSHFGKGWSGTNVPGTWSSTANALERMAFTTKDMILLIDDFAPNGTYLDVRRLHATAERVFRGQANQAGRFRMRADSTLAGSLPPRGLVLATGEDAPKGQSLQARLVLSQVASGEVDVALLSQAQDDSYCGKYALSMSAFAQRIAKKADEEDLSEIFGRKRVVLRTEAASSGHARGPDNVASLLIGAEEFLEFASEVGAISTKEFDDLRLDAWRALTEQASEQSELVSGLDPASRFISLVAAAVTAKRAHIAGMDGSKPHNGTALGWELREIGENVSFVAQGRLIGWIDGDDVYLEPESAAAIAKQFARDQAHDLLFSDKRIHSALKESGHLKSSETQRNTVRKTIHNRRRRVLHVSAQKALGIDPEPPRERHGVLNPVDDEIPF